MEQFRIFQGSDIALLQKQINDWYASDGDETIEERWVTVSPATATSPVVITIIFLVTVYEDEEEETV